MNGHNGLHMTKSIKEDTILLSEDFQKISATFLDGYADFVRKGFPAGTIALAMLGATLNLYEMFDLQGELPELLRGVADSIEDKAEKS